MWYHSFNLWVLHIFIVFRSILIFIYSSICVLIDRYKATVITCFPFMKHIYAYVLKMRNKGCNLKIVKNIVGGNNKFVTDHDIHQINIRVHVYSLFIIPGFFSKCVDSVQNTSPLYRTIVIFSSRLRPLAARIFKETYHIAILSVHNLKGKFIIFFYSFC